MTSVTHQDFVLVPRKQWNSIQANIPKGQQEPIEVGFLGYDELSSEQQKLYDLLDEETFVNL